MHTKFEFNLENFKYVIMYTPVAISGRIYSRMKRKGIRLDFPSHSEDC